MDFTPRDPNYKQRVTDSFRRQKFMEFIGAELLDVGPGSCEIQLPFQESLSQQHGFFHAGVVGSLADNAAGYAGYSLMESHASVLTVEFKLNLLAPGKGEALIAKAHVLKSGKTLTVCRSDVYVVNQGVEKLCAAAQVTLIQLENTKDS